VLVHQLLAPVHDTDADAKHAAGSNTADAGHGLGVAAGVVEGELELEGEAVLARVEEAGRWGGGGIRVGEDLADLVQDLVVLDEGVVAVPSPAAGHDHGRVVGRGAEHGAGLALELDDDGADVFMAAEVEHDVAADLVQVGVELGRVV
jgi:hypothetical protein